jgi:hypothetical protein
VTLVDTLIEKADQTDAGQRDAEQHTTDHRAAISFGSPYWR